MKAYRRAESQVEACWKSGERPTRKRVLTQCFWWLQLRDRYIVAKRSARRSETDRSSEIAHWRVPTKYRDREALWKECSSYGVWQQRFENIERPQLDTWRSRRLEWLRSDRSFGRGWAFDRTRHKARRIETKRVSFRRRQLALAVQNLLNRYRSYGYSDATLAKGWGFVALEEVRLRRVLSERWQRYQPARAEAITVTSEELRLAKVEAAIRREYIARDSGGWALRDRATRAWEAGILIHGDGYKEDWTTEELDEEAVRQRERDEDLERLVQLWTWGYLKRVRHALLDPDREYYSVPRPYKGRNLTGAIRRPEGGGSGGWTLKRRRNEDGKLYYQQGVEHRAWLLAKKKAVEDAEDDKLEAEKARKDPRKG